MRKLGIAALAAAGIMATTTAASAQACPLGLIVMGIYTWNTEGRELTQKEAMTCGFIRDEEASAAAKKKTTKKPAKKKKAAS